MEGGDYLYRGVFIRGNHHTKYLTVHRTAYSSPMVLVKNKDGSIRVCVDFRQLNAKTIRDAHPLPRIEEALDCLSRAEYFSTLDLSHGFLQCALDKKDIPKTAFCCGAYGLYEYTRMPMGLINVQPHFAVNAIVSKGGKLTNASAIS